MSRVAIGIVIIKGLCGLVATCVSLLISFVLFSLVISLSIKSVTSLLVLISPAFTTLLTCFLK